MVQNKHIDQLNYDKFAKLTQIFWTSIVSQVFNWWFELRSAILDLLASAVLIFMAVIIIVVIYRFGFLLLSMAILFPLSWLVLFRIVLLGYLIDIFNAVVKRFRYLRRRFYCNSNICLSFLSFTQVETTIVIRYGFDSQCSILWDLKKKKKSNYRNK